MKRKNSDGIESEMKDYIKELDEAEIGPKGQYKNDKESAIDKYENFFEPNPPVITEVDLLKTKHVNELVAITDKLEAMEQKMNELFNMLKLIGGRENVKGN